MVQALTQKVMGDANYLVNPCVIVCPFAGPKCQHGHFRMNGNCKVQALPAVYALPPGPETSHAHTIQRLCVLRGPA